ncbi:probable 2-ketogluconate reductase isoform X2 [Solea solea]|nr:probable 2-ketogluconate reductase isoform X2 [Solea solea]
MMEEEKPWALVEEVEGDFCYPEEIADALKQHFQIITLSELLQNPGLNGRKIQVLVIWKFFPAAEPKLLKMLPSLKIVVCTGTGTDHLDIPFISSLGVKIANTAIVVSDATADLAMALLLASARKILESQQIAVDPKTVQIPLDLLGVEVTGSTIGIIGMGDIGYRIAQRCSGFQMKILYHNRRKRSEDDERAVKASFCESLNELLRRSDFVVIAVKLTSQTKGLFGHRELSLMKPTATLINISRGQVVDQDALVKALQSGAIRAAALDVTHPEPLPRDHPLLSLPNVLITPHIGINTNCTARRIVEKMAENALAAIRGLPIPNEVKSQ